ncbi:molybdopterin cofactor-binding domain-containing protein [Paraburkholderia sp. RAU6.4a]|uniref:xanthine dehydrogenase family protein molybdopterin-binding subunit n=1 Tax=Paraburkholderia sp. RAU6.4a TaxID=2991067 RepID=UPI003D1B0CFA
MDDDVTIAGGVNRRQFLAGMTALTLTISFRSGTVLAAPKGVVPETFEPNAFIRISADGRVTVVSSYLEMGQGTFTGIATLAADELDVDPQHVDVVAAPADASRYTNPVLAKRGYAVQGTGGSSAMAGAWSQMRQAAATARAMLVSTAAKRWKVEQGSLTVENGTIIHVASGRRAGYGAFVADASREPVPTNVAVKQARAFRLIGQPTTRRVDVPAKVDGSAIYTQDIKLPGMLVAVVAHPPRLWAKVRYVDASKAKAIPGVVAVVQLDGDDNVQAGVAVLAKNTWVARQGRDALSITWDDTHALSLGSDALSKQYRALADTPGPTAMMHGTVLEKAPDGGKLIEAVYEQPYLAHAAMEPMNCVVYLHADRCEIWNGEQWHTADQHAVAQELGFKPGQVTITQLYAGGSFGRRANPRSDYVREAVRIARATRAQGIDAPVKMVWMREDDMRATQYRPMTVHKVRIVVDRSGKLVSWHQVIVGQSFTKPKTPDAIDRGLVEGATSIRYDIPNIRIDQHIPDNVAVPTQWLRSVGHTHAAFVNETMIDEAARAAGQDPYRFRCSMLVSRPRERAVLDLAADKAGWQAPLRAGAVGERRGRGIAFQFAFGTYVAQIAEVTVKSDGSFSVDRIVCAVDCGFAINPNVIAAQMEGGIGFGLSFLRQAIRLDNGRILEGNFNDYPVLRMNGMPRIEVHIAPSHEAPTGVGEPGVPPAVPAVVNALAMATGTVIRTLPLGDAISAS